MSDRVFLFLTGAVVALVGTAFGIAALLSHNTGASLPAALAFYGGLFLVGEALFRGGES